MPKRPYERIVFNDLSPEWYVVNYDAATDNGIFDGFNNFRKIQEFKPLIFDNSIFELYFQQNTLEPTGTYIQRRNLEDGSLIWRRYIGYPDDPQQILGRNLKINLNNQLEVIFQVKCDPYDPFFPLLGRTNMALYKICFDNVNGNTVSDINYSCNDISVVQTNFDLFYINKASRFYSIGNLFYFTQSKWTGSKWNRVIYKLKSEFYKDSIYSKSFPKKYTCFGDLPILFNDSTKIVFNSNCSTKKLEMTFIDDEFNIIKTVISDSLSHELNELQVKEFDPVNQRLLLENVINFDTREIELLIIDIEGKLLKRIHVPVEFNRNYGLIEWDNIDQIMLLSPLLRYTLDQRPYVSLDVLKSNNEGKINHVHSFVATDSLRFVSMSNLIGFDDEHFYIELIESCLFNHGNTYQTDENAAAHSLMKIKKKSLLHPISATHQSTTNHIHCYPNPTSGLITIKGLSQQANVHVIDVNGKIIKKFENVEDKINLGDIPTGVYNLHIIENNTLKRIRVVKINE